MSRDTENRIIGQRFETELCEKLSEYGWWVHNMAQNQDGQPADIIAVKWSTAVLMDAKVCLHDKFSLNRIEPNQESAMMLWDKCCNQFAYFALKLSDNSIYMISFDEIQTKQRSGKRILNERDIRNYMSFYEWVERMESCF